MITIHLAGAHEVLLFLAWLVLHFVALPVGAYYVGKDAGRNAELLGEDE